MADEGEQNQADEPQTPRGWSAHPPEKMLITPWVAGIGGVLVFFTVVFVVVWLPVHTFDPPPSNDWAPLSDQARKGRVTFASNNCNVCHSGFSRPQDVRQALYFLYPKVSEKEVKPPPNQLEEAPNLSQIDRSYWLSADPLPVTEANLLRGKEVFLSRCVGCHGPKGDGKGPAATFMSPPPADFTDKDDACCGGDTGPGDFYYRILRGWPGTAMENF